MKCLINGTGIQEGLFPLTCETPAGLLSLEKKDTPQALTILDRLLFEIEESSGTEGIFLVTCEKYESAYRVWLEQRLDKEKIRLLSAPENTTSLSLANTWITGDETLFDWLIVSHNTTFYIHQALSEWLQKETRNSCRFFYGNESSAIPLEVYLLRNGQIPESEEKLFLKRPEQALTELPRYERLLTEAGGPRIYPEFSVQAYTQERYGDRFISSIRMENTILCKSSTLAYVQVENKGKEELNRENTRIGYHLWLEQTYKDSYQVDKIPMEQKDPLPLPTTIRPGESAEIPVPIEAPALYGKYYLQMDLEVDGRWLAADAPYFCFPHVSFIGEVPGQSCGAALAAESKVFLTGTVESANAGEQLEAEAASRLLQKILPLHHILEYSVSCLEDFWQGAGRLLNQKDRIVPYASGCLGAPETSGEENFRRRTAPVAASMDFPVPFVLPPQHMAFPDTAEGREQLKYSTSAYQGSNYCLLCGNEEDFIYARKHFSGSRLGKAPRLSFGMEAPELTADAEEFIVVVCGGSREGFLDAAFGAIDSRGWHRMFLNLDYNAYQPGAWFGPKSRQFLIRFCCETVGRRKVVVTDTVYGLSYALMCHRPCVILGHREEQEWFRGRKDIYFLEDLSQLPEACESALREKSLGPLPLSAYADMERFLL